MATTGVNGEKQAAPSSFIRKIAIALKMPQNSAYDRVINKIAAVSKPTWDMETYRAVADLDDNVHDQNNNNKTNDSNIITIMSHNARGLKGKLYSEHGADLWAFAHLHDVCAIAIQDHGMSTGDGRAIKNSIKYNSIKKDEESNIY